MKLKANNLTGYLIDGTRYKIVPEDKKSEILTDKRSIIIGLYTFNENLGAWFMQAVTVRNYTKKTQRKSAMKEAFVEAENKFGIQLLKSDLKVAS